MGFGLLCSILTQGTLGNNIRKYSSFYIIIEAPEFGPRDHCTPFLCASRKLVRSPTKWACGRCPGGSASARVSVGFEGALLLLGGSWGFVSKVISTFTGVISNNMCSCLHYNPRPLVTWSHDPLSRVGYALRQPSSGSTNLTTRPEQVLKAKRPKSLRRTDKLVRCLSPCLWLRSSTRFYSKVLRSSLRHLRSVLWLACREENLCVPVFEGVEGVGISPQNPNPFLNNLLLPGAPVQPRRFQLAVAGCPAPYIHRKEPPARLA